MGSLFWQLGDCWPAVSWSCVDYFGERKALYYQAAKAFSPELISPVVENDTIKVFFVSDSPDSPEGALRLRLLDFDGNLLKEIEEPLPPSLPRGEPLYRIGREALIEGHAAGAVVLTCELVRGRDAAARNLFYFAPPKDLILPDPGLGANVREIPGGGGFIVELVAERIAKDVFLSMPGCVGTFSDNFFDMLPGETVTVIFKTAEKPADPGRRLRIKTLADAR
jgi:beta-mannosidase